MSVLSYTEQESSRTKGRWELSVWKRPRARPEKCKKKKKNLRIRPGVEHTESQSIEEREGKTCLRSDKIAQRGITTLPVFLKCKERTRATYGTKEHSSVEQKLSFRKS